MQLSAFVDEISGLKNGKRLSVEHRFYVIRNGSQPLLIKGNAETLGILKFTVPETNSVSINALSK